MIDIFFSNRFWSAWIDRRTTKKQENFCIKRNRKWYHRKLSEVELIVLLIDERSEEVTDLERSVKGDVVSSYIWSAAAKPYRASELVLERAMRLVEDKRDVVILMDSITRLLGPIT